MHPVFRRRRRAISLTGFVLALFAGAWLLQFALRAAPLSVDGPALTPSILAAFEQDAPVSDAQQWRSRRAPLLREAFAEEVYGDAPAAMDARIATRRLIDAKAFDGAGRLEEIDVEIDAPGGAVRFALLLLTPNDLAAPAPLVITPNFCGNTAALGGRYRNVTSPRWMPERCRTLGGRMLARLLHGDNIIRPPFARLIKQGYAVACFFPFEVAPDDVRLAPTALARLADAGERVGAVGAWAWSFSRVIDVLEGDPRLDAQRIAAFGHSRFGKAALWAAAGDARIDLVIANQSGRLGAAPSQSRIGERLSNLARAFPHWFPALAEDENVEVDQHQLLGLIAPRPVLLGGARMDRWSDPAGAFRAAREASDVYRLFGVSGLEQPDMTRPNFSAAIAVYLRPGGHGVRPSDWTYAIDFLDAHFDPPAVATPLE